MFLDRALLPVIRVAIASMLAWGFATNVRAAAPSLRSVLTAEEFRRAGLDKLTEAELAFLSGRLLGTEKQISTSQGEAQPIATLLAGESAFGQEPRLHAQVEKLQRVPREIHSEIPGLFTGWTGNTTFALLNGQVWRQAEPNTFSVRLNSPAVVIRKGSMDSFFLQIAGYGSVVKVKRVK